MGPWSDLVFRPLGYPFRSASSAGTICIWRRAATRSSIIPFRFRSRLSAGADEPGIRLATGVEFARRDAPPTPIQLRRALPRARQLFPLGKRSMQNPGWEHDRAPPDMLPVIGRATAPSGCGFDFGHQHHGLTPAADRPPAGGDDDRRDAVRRSHPLCGRAFRLTISAECKLGTPPAPSGRLRRTACRGDTVKSVFKRSGNRFARRKRVKQKQYNRFGSDIIRTKRLQPSDCSQERT